MEFRRVLFRSLKIVSQADAAANVAICVGNEAQAGCELEVNLEPVGKKVEAEVTAHTDPDLVLTAIMDIDETARPEIKVQRRAIDRAFIEAVHIDEKMVIEIPRRQQIVSKARALVSFQCKAAIITNVAANAEGAGGCVRLGKSCGYAAAKHGDGYDCSH